MSEKKKESRILTERICPRSTGFDTWSSSDILTHVWQDQINGVAAVRTAIKALEQAALGAVERLQEPDSRLIYVGAGSSGVLAGLDGIELPCTFGWPKSRLAIYRADDADNVLTITTPGDDDKQSALRDFKKSMVTDKDVLVAVSASGETPYTCQFAKLAAQQGTQVIGIAHNPRCLLLHLATDPILLDTGPEVLAGSTRLKAGTAQKTALGMFSTLVMTRLGHVHDGLLIDVEPDNAKLRKRAARSVASIANVPEKTAQTALKQTDFHVKPAVLVAKGMTPKQAQEKLYQSGGNLREALIHIAEV
ncbi:N-acetylmuramic acid 6-phosphate etherase [Pseudodesulfovibrio sp. JC047]|uniref:N-acetylmuramic acid 6-phosphate etherase n=1 Tax=Pseudodesulfovibrio sp. JC047 TaxID=2683199 RepID=UPI0013D532B3|nr:N-acetylmuramic acid 6-phosphate etherase [Pseudodesulfovibrio sp. JC047]NDV18690.1 N-acetylmuramic acid 6-phosphate etherase [Pseudodesulfovibrio sp. JC047]